MIHVTEERFRQVLRDKFTGVGNEWDEEEDVKAFEEILDELVSHLAQDSWNE